MAIVIDATTNVATVTESTSFVGRAMDGVMGAAMGSDNLTSKEAFAAFWTAIAGGTVIGSKLARSNVAKGKPAFLGFIG